MNTTRIAVRAILLGLAIALTSLAMESAMIPGQSLFMSQNTHAPDLAAQVEYELAMDECEPLPAGELPGGAVIDWADERPTAYTEVHAEVSLAFKRAVGERKAPAIDALTLCR